MGKNKAATLIKSEYARFFSRACQDGLIFAAIMAKDVFQQARGIALALGARTGCQIFQFARSLAFVGDHAEAFQIRIKECEQIDHMPRAFTHTWFFFGDSLTLGVNDNRMPGGWVSRLVLLGQEAGLYRFPPATFYNLGARRQSTADLARRWRQEVDCRQMPGVVPHLVFCAGVVDMAAPGGGQPVALDKAMYCLRTMLTEAAPLAPTLVISPPPVADPTVRRHIAELSAAQAALCAELIAYALLLGRGMRCPAFFILLCFKKHNKKFVYNALTPSEYSRHPHILLP